MGASDASAPLLVCAVVGAVCAGGALWQACEQCAACEEEGTCSSMGLCACATSASAASALSVMGRNDSLSALGHDVALSTLVQGVCSPGETFEPSIATGDAECRSYFPFPSALNAAIQDDGAPTAHERACGRWIDAGGHFDEPEYVYRAGSSFEAWAVAIDELENRATSTSELATGAPGKFRAECARTVEAGAEAIVAAAALGYEHLVAEMGALDDADALLKGTAVLARHYCEGPSTASLAFASGGGFAAVIHDLGYFTPGALAAALSSVGADAAVGDAAERASEAITEHYLAESATLELDDDQLRSLYRHATAQNDDTPLDRSPIAHTTALPAALLAHAADGADAADDAAAYLKGAAAFCAFELRAQVDAGAKFTSDFALAHAHLAAVRAARPAAAALGRVPGLEDDEEAPAVPAPGAVAHAPNASLQLASGISLAQLGAGVDGGNAETDCLAFMRGLFADDLDSQRFAATVPEALYARLEGTIADVRDAVAAAPSLSANLSAVYYDPAGAAAAVRASKLRIAGAPRGTWAGLSADVPRAALASGDGVFVMGLKQASAIFLDRVARLAVNETDACEHPVLADSLLGTSSFNAYALPAYGCTVVLLGMASRPWFDELYDDESLLARGGWLVAHELAHVAAAGGLYLWTTPYAELLAAYPEASRYEALADVHAALGITTAQLVERERLIAHVCQLWCARVAVGYEPSPLLSHPAPNDRCDDLETTLLSLPVHN